MSLFLVILHTSALQVQAMAMNFGRMIPQTQRLGLLQILIQDLQVAIRVNISLIQLVTRFTSLPMMESQVTNFGHMILPTFQHGRLQILTADLR